MVKEKDANLLKNFVTEIMKNFAKFQNKQVVQKIIQIKQFVEPHNSQTVVLLKNKSQVSIVTLMKSKNLLRHLCMKHKEEMQDVLEQWIFWTIGGQVVLDLVVKTTK